MKYILVLLLFYSGQAISQTKVYDITIQGTNGNSINISSFKGKKILVASISPSNLKNGQLNFLDSLQLSHPDVYIIAIPASDFEASNSTSDLVDSIKRVGIYHFIITNGGYVKKDKGINQYQLMKWLTNDTDNTHFNSDVNTDDQLYFISESGILYAVLEKGAQLDLIDALLKQQDIKQ
ncbi:hypothetical protein [Flavihumibacter profundi]|uniref:hypothetical protein n=1 Tax=Flavihumibacter profundi TaxID=2716883 RepID=UPI001CC71F20|nr:hypothetical protein [Flavihumibacter profundi]MBZ5858562.1 hypothetical protein [Flavihumibacter profundi]